MWNVKCRRAPLWWWNLREPSLEALVSVLLVTLVTVSGCSPGLSVTTPTTSYQIILWRQKLPIPSTRHRTCGCAALACYCYLLLPSLACFQNLCAAAPSSAGQLWVLISFVWTRHASYLISSNLTSSSQFDEWLFILRLWRTLHSDGGLSWEAGFRSDCARRFFNKKYIGTYDREAAQSWDLSR